MKKIKKNNQFRLTWKTLQLENLKKQLYYKWLQTKKEQIV